MQLRNTLYSFRHYDSPNGLVIEIDDVTVGSCPMPQINFWQMEDNGVQFGGINNDQILGTKLNTAQANLFR